MSKAHHMDRGRLRALSETVMGGVFALMLTGCAYLAPTQERLVAPVPVQWPVSVDGKTPMPADWNLFFPDPRLRAMIATALEHNRDLRIAVARVDEARAQFGVQRADQVPNVQLGLGRTETQTPAGVASGGAQTTTRRTDMNLGLLSFELDFWGRVASLSAAARATYLATEEAHRAFRLSLIADVADAYWGLQEAQERAALAGGTVTSRRDTLRLVETRRDVGLASDLDVLQARGSLESARAELANLERQRGQSENLLRVLVGMERAEWPEAYPLKDQRLLTDVAVGIPAEVLLRRPDILAAEQRLQAANAMIGAARAAFFPRIALTGSFGSASPELAGLFDPSTTAWTFTPSITLPIFAGGRLTANLDVANARKEIAVADYERTIQQAFREVADGLVARQKIGEQVHALEMVEAAQRQRSVIAQVRYDQGVASFLEVLDAQRELFSAQQALIAARRTWSSASARLYKALGGGVDPVLEPTRAPGGRSS